MENDRNNGVGDTTKQYDGDIKNSFKDKAKKWQKFITQVPSTFDEEIFVFSDLFALIHRSFARTPGSHTHILLLLFFYLPKMVHMFFIDCICQFPLIPPCCHNHKCICSISQNIKGTALLCIQDIVMVFWNLEAYKAKCRTDYSKFLRKIINPRSQYKVHK